MCAKKNQDLVMENFLEKPVCTLIIILCTVYFNPNKYLANIDLLLNSNIIFNVLFIVCSFSTVQSIL